MVPSLCPDLAGEFAMLTEPILPGTKLVVCKTCDKDGFPFLMPEWKAPRHIRMCHPEEAEQQQSPVLEEAQAS
jgi:hypothetical protein